MGSEPKLYKNSVLDHRGDIMNTGEKHFDIPIQMPKDISKEFYNHFKDFLDDSEDDIQGYFRELLTFKRCVFQRSVG